MIKEIFLPEKIGARRILAQRIIGLSLHEDAARLVQVYARGSKTYVEKFFSEPIAHESLENYSDFAVQAIKKLMLQIKSYDQVRVSIPSSMVIFKELQLQFTDPEKIRMVLDFEVESLLPFSLDEAVVDFIITKVNKEQNSSQILVAAVRNQDLQDCLTLYASAGIDPTAITIDLFSSYELYLQIPDYQALKQGVALVELGLNTTRVAFIQDGQLRLTRYIQRGFNTVLKLISDETKITIPELAQKLEADGIAGIGDEALVRIAQKHFVLLLNDIQFTLNSFSIKLNFYEGVSKVLLSGKANHIKDFMVFCSDTLQIPSEIFEVKKLFSNKLIKNKIKETVDYWDDFATALGTALPPVEHGDFDLRRKQFSLHRESLIVKQIIAAGVIIITLLCTIGTKGYIDISRLAQQAESIEKREVNRLKTESIFSRENLPKKLTLQVVVKAAEKIVKEKQETWASFVQPKMNPLALWFELTRIIDKKQFSVTIKNVSMSTKDDWVPKIEVDGFFKSKTNDHFKDFEELENRFKDSLVFKVVEQIDATPAPEGGVNFSVKLRLKEA